MSVEASIQRIKFNVLEIDKFYYFKSKSLKCNYPPNCFLRSLVNCIGVLASLSLINSEKLETPKHPQNTGVD